MKKSPIFILLAMIVLSLTISTTKAEAAASPKQDKYIISLNAWNAQLTKSFSTNFSEKSDQTFFPVFIGYYNISDHWKLSGEYGSSRMTGLTPERAPGLEEEASRTVFGLRYDPMPGLYFNFAYPSMKLNMENPTNTFKMNAKITGIQLGMGLGMYIKEPHVALGLEYNFSEDMQMLYTSGAGWAKAKGPAMDVKALVCYKFDQKWQIHGGFRYMMMDASAATFGNMPVPKIKFTLKGPFFGMKYSF
ncbi:MAG TPA: outer membrane beta-barrel protein [bacterium]|nr:outer membrane beta-barrel protein [bacterium]